MLKVLEDRGLCLGRDRGDPYAQKLIESIRSPLPLRRLDRLLVSAIIEARSCERLALVADGVADREMKRLYSELAQSEHGHQLLFFRLAGSEAASERLHALLEREAQIINDVGIRPAIH